MPTAPATGKFNPLVLDEIHTGADKRQKEQERRSQERARQPQLKRSQAAAARKRARP
jgi:hypothetical protein